MQPDVRYARNDGVAIAYQVVGDAGRDLVFVPDFISNLVYGWESPYWREFYERLARSFRLILFDKRGTGLSDRGGAGWAALETRMEDMRVVLEAAGSEHAVVLGADEGGQMAALYAASYPEATEGLVLFQFRPQGLGSTAWSGYRLGSHSPGGERSDSPTSSSRRSARRCSAVKPIGCGSRTGCALARVPRSGSR